MTGKPRTRYLSDEEDSARWERLTPRDGDIVVSTRSKHGTTWVQTILLMLIHGVELPARLPVLSPWLDHLVEPIDRVSDRLDAQRHRRVIKTHTPLDGLPLNDATTYVVIARDPVDAAVSLYHQAANIDWRRRTELTGADHSTTRSSLPGLSTWLREWIMSEASPTQNLDSLAGVLHHLQDAWGRRDAKNVTLLRYADLMADLAGQIERLAKVLDLPGHNLEAIAEATTFEAMHANAEVLAPDALGELRDRSAFFRHGRMGEGRESASSADLAHYHRILERRAPMDLAAWLAG